MISYILVILLGGVYGYAICLSQVESLNEETYNAVKDQNGEKWDKFLDNLKRQTKESKIEELEKAIEELKDE